MFFAIVGYVRLPMFSGVPPQVEEGTFRVEFPDIFRTLILNREIMPGGRGKRLRVRGDFTGIVANIQANQASYLYLYLQTGGCCPALWGWVGISMCRVRMKGNACKTLDGWLVFRPPQCSTG